MDDLAGLSWSSKPNNAKTAAAPSYNYNASAFATLKPTPPTSGRASPFNSTSPQPPSKPSTPANDSFSNLVSFSGGSNSKNISLQEQQKRLEDLRRKQQESRTKTLQEQYSGGDEAFWTQLGSGRSTPAAEANKNGTNLTLQTQEDEMFASFNAPIQPSQTKISTTTERSQLEDDDPFGLSDFTAKKSQTQIQSSRIPDNDDDDVLGLLGQPVSNRPPPDRQEQTPPPSEIQANPQDKAIAELVDMGFPVEKARQALETTESGTDVQSAVGWLLNQAHAEARQKTQARKGSKTNLRNESNDAEPRRSGSSRLDQVQRRDMQTEDVRRREQASTPTDRDPAQLAAELGNNFLKTAGSLWKTGTKKVQQAVQDFNSDSDSSQPKWMKQPDRTTTSDRTVHPKTEEAGVTRRRRRSSQEQRRKDPSFTDEAMMLEASRPTPPPKQPPRIRPENRVDSSADNSRDHSPAFPSRLRDSHSPQPAFLRQQQPKPSAQPTAPSRTALNRQAIEDQAAQAYVSSARRRKPATQPVAVAPEPDLLEGASKQELPSRPSPSSRSAQPPQTRPTKSTPVTVRPPPPTRNIPTISSISLKACHSQREKGNEFFKRGDYSSSHQAYSTAITHLPSTHPLIIVLLTNRALTALKIGEPKTAIIDSDSAISVIGSSKGENETIDFATGNNDPPKPMREYYGKALMRKAEALEQMEKWTEAATVWREAIEGGHGGATSMQGRLRAEKAANPAPKPKPPTSQKKAVVPPRRPAGPTQPNSTAAVIRLRAANAAAEKADDEKFALSDSVEARINNWKGGKADNLRALLGSLDTVLWEGSGWKKISMADLVLPAKVKVQYMKGIAKVHPDKIPTDATTEQRMISSAVFSALNEAWDKFKTENGL